jgi:hypothetical protein
MGLLTTLSTVAAGPRLPSHLCSTGWLGATVQKVTNNPCDTVVTVRCLFVSLIRFSGKNIESHLNTLIFSLKYLDHTFLGCLHSRYTLPVFSQNATILSLLQKKSHISRSRPPESPLPSSSPMNRIRPGGFFALDPRSPPHRWASIDSSPPSLDRRSPPRRWATITSPHTPSLYCMPL